MPEDERNAAPSTTKEEDRHSLGQRRINLIWELTQGFIAMLVTGAIIYTSIIGIKSESLTTAFTLIMTLYFVRTNHTKVGGPGGTDSR